MHKAISPSVRSTFAVLALTLLTGAAGCTFGPSRQATEKDAPIRAEDVRVTSEQLRLRMRSLVGPMCGQIEQSADAISTASTDTNVKLAALKWKMEAVPAMREAIFRPDPYSAAFDTAALCMQMTEYFEHGPGKEALGPASAQAAAACRSMTEEYLKVVASATSSGDISKARDYVQKWAADHPIRHSIADRETALSRVYEQEFISSRSATEYIADTSATADDLARKMDVYSGQLFRQARWEAERLQLELVRDYHIDQAMPLAERAVKSAEQAASTVDHITPALERSLEVAQGAPKLVVAERETVIKAVHDEMTRVLESIRDERVIALEQVSKERAIGSGEIKDALSAQATQLATDAQRISKLEIDYVMEKTTRLVSISLAVALAFVFLGLLIRRRTGRAAKRYAGTGPSPFTVGR
jgi:hypothetical protein